MRFKARVTEAGDQTTIYAERGVWNLPGAYAVLIGLLIIFTGYFMTSRGYTGHMRIKPNQSSDRLVKNGFNFDNATTERAVGAPELTLPFTVECLDFQQKLMNKDGSLELGNTVDWITTVRITDHETKQKTDAVIQMNTPFDYRGYRFFQAGYNMPATARVIQLRVKPASGGESQEITIKREGEAKLADGTLLRYSGFHPNFSVGRDQKMDNGAHQFVLTGFEKAPTWTVVSVQFDKGAAVVFAGFTILCLMLIGASFFSRQRLWIVVEDGNVYLGGDANGNRLGFEDRAKKVAALIRQPQTAG